MLQEKETLKYEYKIFYSLTVPSQGRSLLRYQDVRNLAASQQNTAK